MMPDTRLGATIGKSALTVDGSGAASSLVFGNRELKEPP